jgi:glycosyltransferase involved in cell wall biosynthesis
MIKVTHVVFMSEMPGIYPFSGLENHLMILLPALSRRQVDVELIVLTWQVGPEMRARLAELEAAGVTVTLLFCSPQRPWRWLGLRRLEQANRLRSLLAQRRDRIIHCHIDLLVAGLAICTSGCRQILISIHNDEPWLKNPGWRLWLRWLDRRVCHYIAISEQVRRHYMAAAGLEPHKIEKIYYGVTLKPTTAVSQEIRRQYQIPPNSFVVGFVGRLTHQKNVPLLLAALRQLPDVHAVLVGDGELRQELQAMANEWELTNVQFLGRQPDAAALMPAFDAFCLPSLFEGLGLVLVEAMLQEVPIIGSRAGAIPEILGDGKYGLLFNSNDVNGLVQAIHFIRQEQQSMAGMVERALSYAQNSFTVEAMVNQTIERYKKVSCAS